MKRNIIALAMLIMLFGCSNEKKSVGADTIDATETDSSSLSVMPASDTTLSEKLIKTADMRFRVKDARKTKIELSKMLKDFNGKMLSSSVTSSIAQQEKVKYSMDSLVEITAYHTEGHMVLKVPSERLDEFSDLIAASAMFVDNQSLESYDRGGSYLSNKLKAQNRVEAISTINKLASRKNNNVEAALLIKDDYVDKKIENLQTDYQVKFSTISLSFYQANTVTKVIVGNDNLSDFRPAFFRRLWLNLLNGWSIFTEVILALSNVWVFVVFGIAVYFGITYYIKRNRNVW